MDSSGCITAPMKRRSTGPGIPGVSSSAVSGRNDRMSSTITGKSTTVVKAASSTRLAGSIFLSPWVCGPLLTTGFYLLLSQLPQQAEAAKRYFDGNWVLYVETGLFFVGVALLLRKTLGLLLDHRALRLILID